MKKKSRILFIHHGIGIGGAPISLLNLISNLDKEKYEVKVTCLREGDHVKLFKNADIKTEVIKSPTFFFTHNETGKKQWYYLPYYFIVLFDWLYTAFLYAPKYLKTQEYDIIHLNSHVLTSWAYAAKKRGFKVIIHNREAVTRGYVGLRYSILKKLIQTNCDHVINISKDNETRLGIFENSSVIYNFVAIPDEYRSPMSNPKKDFKVLYLGGIASIKGFDTVVGCVKFLNKGIKLQVAGNVDKFNFRINIKGFIKYFIEFIKGTNNKIKYLENSDKVQLLGTLSNPYTYINECDILITPFKIEHFSRPAIEAFAYGKPVIGSNVVGMDEIIDHELNGLLIEKNNSTALANAINYLALNPRVTREYGQMGREKAIKIFSSSPNMKLLYDIYDKVLES